MHCRIIFYKYFWKRPFTLNDLMEEAKNVYPYLELIVEIIVFLQDEHSHEEDIVAINNLHGVQLKTEVMFRNIETTADYDTKWKDRNV